MIFRRPYRYTCHYVALFIASMALVAASPDVAWAQGPTGSLSGTVVDESGGLVPGVTVTIRSVDTGLRREVITDTEGVFAFPLLQPSRYVLSATLQGFAPM